MDKYDQIRSKPLIELLRIAEAKGVIDGWTVKGPSLVLQQGSSNTLVRAVDAGEVLVRMIRKDQAGDEAAD